MIVAKGQQQDMATSQNGMAIDNSVYDAFPSSVSLQCEVHFFSFSIYIYLAE